MEKRILRHFGYAAFIVYFCLFILIPVTHYHAAEVLSDNTTFEIGHGPKQLPFFSVVQCCEFHEGDSEADHIHFLTDDQCPVTRNNRTDSSLALQALAAVDEVFFLKPPYQCIGIIDSMADFYQETVFLYSSGLSPPLS